MFVLSFSLLKFPVPGLTFLRADTRVTSLTSWHHFSDSILWPDIFGVYFFHKLFGIRNAATLLSVGRCERHCEDVVRSEEWGVLPRPRLSPHWPGHRVSGTIRGDSASTARPTGGSLCPLEILLPRKHKDFSQSVTHANTTIGRGSICLLVVRVEISKFCFTLKVLKVVSGYH